MRKTIFVLGILATAITWATAQQLPLYSQYAENGFLLNPAMAGSRMYSPLRLSIRKQWSGVEGAPETQALSFNKNLENKNLSCNIMGNPFARRNKQRGVGVGGYFFNDKYGDVSRSGIELSYAYHLQLTRQSFVKSGTKLAFGLGGLFYQFKLDKRDIPTNDPKYGANEISYIPDANFGIYLYNDNYFIGAAVAHLFESSVKMGDNNINGNIMKRHFYATVGCTFHFRSLVDLEPSIIVRKTLESGIFYDASAKLYIRHFWTALSYRTNKQIIGMLGVSYNHYYLGYSYDYYSNNLIANGSNGTHEITLGVNFNIPNRLIIKNKLREQKAAYRNLGKNR